MKTYVFLFLIVSSILAGCTAGNTPAAPTPSPIAPTSALLSETTSTSTVVISEVSSPTITVVEATAAIDSTQTTEPTATVAVLQMEFVGEPGQNPVTQQPQPCQRPQNWVAYTVQRSDTLSSLGQRTGVGWQQIQTANCLTGTTILAGQTLYLPFVPATTKPPDVGAGPTIVVETIPPPGPGDPTVIMVPTAGPPATKFKILITDFDANEAITIRVFYAPSLAIVFEKSAVVNGDGDLIEYFPATANAEVGNYTVDVSGVTSAATGSFEITTK